MAPEGNATFAPQIHVIEHLPFGHLYRIGVFQQTIGQRGFTMVNVRNNAKVSYILHEWVFRKIYETQRHRATESALSILSLCVSAFLIIYIYY